MNVRIVIVVSCVIVLAGAFFIAIPKNVQSLLVTNASAIRQGGIDNRVSVFFTLQNAGGPDQLLLAESSSAARAVIMAPPPYEVSAIPAGSSPIFASDGTYIALFDLREEVIKGDLLPITLTFKKAGKLSFKAIYKEAGNSDPGNSDPGNSDPGNSDPGNSDPGKSDHSRHGMGIMSEDKRPPSVSIRADKSADPPGWNIAISTENFTFAATPPEPVHIPGEGHAHLYVNGLKLQRVYGHQVHIGELLPGQHQIKIILNTHTHMAFMANGAPVIAKVTILSPYDKFPLIKKIDRE